MASAPRIQLSATPTVAAVAETIMRELRARGDPGWAQGTQRYFKEPVTALGLDAATQRQYAREQVARLKPAWSAAEAERLCDRLLREPELEIRGAGLLILGGFSRQFEVTLIGAARRWLERSLDNWALVDTFAGVVLDPLLERHPAIEADLRKWSLARSLWVRRAALVAVVPSARRGQRLDLAYELADSQLAAPEDLMHKATGWLLREAGRSDPARLRAFLLSRGAAVPRTALRYAIERFAPGERQHLLRATRAPRRASARRPARRR